MLKPLKRSGGRRYYRPEDIQLVARIDQLVHREGYTLRGARLTLEGKGAAASAVAGTAAAPAAPGQVPAADPIRQQLTAIRDRLAAALSAA